jgi:hypothetical protein
MALDPVLAEIRGVREAYASKFHGDVTAMMNDIRQRQAKSERQSVVRRAVRTKVSQPSAMPKG